MSLMVLLSQTRLTAGLSSLMLLTPLLYPLSNFRPIIKCIKPTINLLLPYSDILESLSLI